MTELEQLKYQLETACQANKILQGQLDAMTLIADDHAQGRLNRAEEVRFLKIELQAQAAQIAGMRKAIEHSRNFLLNTGDIDMAIGLLQKSLSTPASVYEQRVQKLVEALKYAHGPEGPYKADEALAAWEGERGVRETLYD